MGLSQTLTEGSSSLAATVWYRSVMNDMLPARGKRFYGASNIRAGAWVASVGFVFAGCPDQLDLSEYERIDPGSTAAMQVVIAAGRFADIDDVTHEIAEFLLDRTEVTVEQYEACVDLGSCSAPPSAFMYSDMNPNFNYGAPNRELHPINGVDWFDAEAYCNWAERRLPTEWEWEWAARGRNEGNTYPWGDTPEPNCNVAVMDDLVMGAGCGLNATNPVGSKSPLGDSPDGVQDLSGNVAEWTSSASIYVPTSRIVRGGSWGYNSAIYFNVAFPSDYDSMGRDDNTGFRCARASSP